MGPGPAPAWNQGALPAAPLERPEGGRREGCQRVGFPREEQRLYSANAEYAQPEDPGSSPKKGSYGLGSVTVSEVLGRRVGEEEGRPDDVQGLRALSP